MLQVQQIVFVHLAEPLSLALGSGMLVLHQETHMLAFLLSQQLLM